MAKIYKSVEELIGNTPLLELTKIEKETGATLLAKVEALNPGGSAKELLHSIREKLFSLEGNYRVLPGHEESTDLDWERVRNPYCGEKA